MMLQLISIKSITKQIFSILTVMVGALTINLISPALTAMASTSDPSVIVFNDGDKIIRPNSTLSGSVSDIDGISSLTIKITSVSGSIDLPATLNPISSNLYQWTAVLSKNAIPVSLVNSDINISITATDISLPKDITVLDFGTYKYYVSDAEIFQEVTETLASLDPNECTVSASLNSITPTTAFGPQNSAFIGLPAEELAQLLANPDQLCMVVANHIHSGNSIESSSIISQVQIPTVNSNTADLVVNPISPGIITVNDARVIAPDFESVEGIMHIVSDIIKPISSEVDIFEIKTNLSSPEIKGTVKNSKAKVIVRINGVIYLANNLGDGSWVIPAGVVNLNPKDKNTFFTVLAYTTPASSIDSPKLLGITMKNNILSYLDIKQAVQSTLVTGSGVISAISTIISDQNSSSNDYSPQTNPASINTSSSSTEKESDMNKESDLKKQDKQNKDNSQWYWWVIGVATLGALYYILGGSNQSPNITKKTDK